MSDFAAHPASFRDPSGFLFEHEGSIFRHINLVYREHFDHLIGSGLYDALVKEGLLIPHREVEIRQFIGESTYKIIRPDRIPFISYPYEWCFSQLKDAALATLRIQKTALDNQMVLKDGSAYNIQFLSGRPVLMDTLSFAKYTEGLPWVAYRQFCQHFLAPLALMSLKDVRLNQLFRIYLDGIPLDLSSSLLPRKSLFSFPLLTHVHLHAKSQKHYAQKSAPATKRKITRMQMLALIDNLESAVRKLEWKPARTEWADYYRQINYPDEAFTRKKALVASFIDRVRPRTLWDLGSNTGLFSAIASQKGILTLSFDIDPAAVEINYLKAREAKDPCLLPLLMDLTNPSPAIGWRNRERMSLTERGPVDMVLALALIHHLAITHNCPLDRIAQFFGELAPSLAVEFVPKEDSQVRKLFTVREDVFRDYHEEHFRKVFERYFNILQAEKIEGTVRTLYLMQRRKQP